MNFISSCRWTEKFHEGRRITSRLVILSIIRRCGLWRWWAGDDDDNDDDGGLVVMMIMVMAG